MIFLTFFDIFLKDFIDEFFLKNSFDEFFDEFLTITSFRFNRDSKQVNK